MEVSEQLTGFELEDLMSWTVSNLQRPLERTFLSKKAASSQKKDHKYLGVVLSALTGRKSGALFQFLKGRWLQRLKRQAGEDLSDLIFLQQEDRSHGHPKHKSSASLP